MMVHVHKEFGDKQDGHLCVPLTIMLLEYIYHGLVKEQAPKSGVGALLSVSAFNHERVLMSCSQ